MTTSIYDHIKIEEKWIKIWEELKLFQSSDKVDSAKENMYFLFAFAYPSGSGLHVGHVESKTALDILARYYRMSGKHVFFPVGWDAFGLPAENFAIKTGTPPAVTTKNAIDTFRRQIKRVGISYDWDNEIATSHPGYYKWTQWIFLQLHKKGLAYQANGMVNWCPSCQTVLANEQVVNGHCERCGSEVIQKEMKQWFFKITEYKDELISGLDEVDWPSTTKQQQLNWIGKSKGISIVFKEEKSNQLLSVWTKFWETIYGVTFVVIAPEKFHEFKMIDHVQPTHRQQILNYLDATSHKTEQERKIGEKEKTGVNTGLNVINPVNGQKVPLYIADYVLNNVGTGVVMGVPAHDTRDFDFAKKFGLACIQVVRYEDQETNEKVKRAEMAFEGDGVLINSGDFNEMSAWGEGKEKMAEWMIEQGFASWQTTYKLRDWLISRQRYWGAPIPIVYDPEGNAHPVKEEHLPWILPNDVEFKPTGESPLKYSKEFKERTERLYGKGWTPEYDTMDTFVDSSWYFLRYMDARNEKEFASREMLQNWLPVDLYMIGPEHIVLHLLYARFFTKFLRDEGYLRFETPEHPTPNTQQRSTVQINEPFKKMRHQGMILGPDGKKMSKSKGNVINPDEVIEKYGADTLRVYEMFMGPIDADKPWSTSSVVGVYRFLNRVYQLVITNRYNKEQEHAPDERLLRKLHQTIQKVTQDIPLLKFNTAIAAMMEFVNLWEEVTKTNQRPLSTQELIDFIKMLAPFAPFMSEELAIVITQDIDSKKTPSIHCAQWPLFDPKMVQEEQKTIVIQVNGKVRGELVVGQDDLDNKEEILKMAASQPKVIPWLIDKKILKEIYIPGKLVNIVV